MTTTYDSAIKRKCCLIKKVLEQCETCIYCNVENITTSTKRESSFYPHIDLVNDYCADFTMVGMVIAL